MNFLSHFIKCCFLQKRSTTNNSHCTHKYFEHQSEIYGFHPKIKLLLIRDTSFTYTQFNSFLPIPHTSYPSEGGISLMISRCFKPSPFLLLFLDWRKNRGLYTKGNAICSLTAYFCEITGSRIENVFQITEK